MSKYYKITKGNDGPLCRDGESYKAGKIYEEENLCEDKSTECARGIYFIDSIQAPLWWRGEPTSIWEVEPLGKIIKVSKGYRTDKLKMVKRLSEKEITKLLAPLGIDYFNRTWGAGDWSTLTAGYDSTLTAGYDSTLTAGDWSTLTAGNRSTLTAGYDSTLICHGDTCWIIKDGRNCILRQIWWDDNESKSAVLDPDEVLKEYEKGDKVKIFKGKVKREGQGNRCWNC